MAEPGSADGWTTRPVSIGAPSPEEFKYWLCPKAWGGRGFNRRWPPASFVTLNVDGTPAGRPGERWAVRDPAPKGTSRTGWALGTTSHLIGPWPSTALIVNVLAAPSRVRQLRIERETPAL